MRVRPFWAGVWIVGCALLVWGIIFLSRETDVKSVPIGEPPTTFKPSRISAVPLRSKESWLAEVQRVSPPGFPNLMREALAIPDAGVREATLRALAVRWMTLAPGTLVEWLNSLSEKETSMQWTRLLPGLLAAAPQVPERIATSASFAELITRMMRAYATQDPAAAAAWARKWLMGQGLDMAIAMVAIAQAKTSLPQANAFLAEIHDSVLQRGAIDAVGTNLAGENPGKAYAWAESLPRELRPAAVAAALRVLIETNPVAAASEFLRFRALVFSEPAAGTVMGGNKFESLDDVAGELAEQLAGSDAQQALVWARALPSAELREAALAGAYSGWARQQPREAAAAVLKEASAPAAEGVFEQWAANDPTAAALEAGKVTNPALRESAAAGAILGLEDLRNNEEDDGGAWVDELPAGEGRDALNALLAKDFAENADPENAWARAAAVESLSFRSTLRREVIAAIAEDDPETAEGLIRNTPDLTPEEARALRASLPSSEADTR